MKTIQKLLLILIHLFILENTSKHSSSPNANSVLRDYTDIPIYTQVEKRKNSLLSGEFLNLIPVCNRYVFFI